MKILNKGAWFPWENLPSFLTRNFNSDRAYCFVILNLKLIFTEIFGEKWRGYWKKSFGKIILEGDFLERRNITMIKNGNVKFHVNDKIQFNMWLLECWGLIAFV